MKSIYFLPNLGLPTFDELNDKLKEKLSEVTYVESFPLKNTEKYFPENYEDKILPDLIFVPTIFDYRNSMIYDGVNFAIRWYFHAISLNSELNFKIVLLGIEDKASFYQNCNYSNFLKCPNVDYAQNSFEDVKGVIDENNIKTFNRNEALEKIDLIGVKPPTSYKSHHSISNEWSILRWSKALNVKAELEIKKNEKNINLSLFYKYLSVKYPISPIKTLTQKISKNDATILLIDDEVVKGWDAIFQEIFKGNKFTSLGKDFKKINDRDKIVDVSFDKAKDADVIILDLRLHDLDFDERDPKELSGYKLLKRIKEYNKGIQVIIFSASNKIWNLQALQDVDGFIIKESPENSIDNLFTEKSIEGLIINLEKSFNLIFVKNIIKRYNEIISRLTSGSALENLVNSYFNISINLLLQTNDDNRFFTFAYLQFFHIIEGIVSFEENFIDGDDASVVVNGKEILVQKKIDNYIEWPITFIKSNGKYELRQHKEKNGNFIKKLDTNFKVSSLLIFKFGQANSSVLNWTKIYTKRNNIVAHYNSGKEISKEDILEIVDFLDYFLDSRNINDQNITKGLKKKTDEENIKALINSGNFKVSKLKK